MESMTGYTFTSCVGCFTSPGIDTRSNGPTAFSVSSERHWQSGVKEIAKVLKRPQLDSNPRQRDCQSHALTTEPPRPMTPGVLESCNEDWRIANVTVIHCT